MINRSILAAIRGENKERQLPDVGTHYDEWYTVILCPVCGHKTLDNYDICTHCGWEYDDLPEDHYSTCNRATLRDYRAQYQKALTMLDMLARKKAAKVVLRPCEVVEIESAEEIEKIRNR